MEQTDAWHLDIYSLCVASLHCVNTYTDTQFTLTLT